MLLGTIKCLFYVLTIHTYHIIKPRREENCSMTHATSEVLVRTVDPLSAGSSFVIKAFGGFMKFNIVYKEGSCMSFRAIEHVESLNTSFPVIRFIYKCICQLAIHHS